jgi:Na+/proline symporter
MFTPLSVILYVTLYMSLLFALAQLVEKRIKIKSESNNSPWIYALSLAVYHTSWTFYGSVGFAASSGMLFLGVYAGAMIGIALWWITLKRMVQAKETFRITSIADFISTRYNRSQKIAALVTTIALIGVVPYISLQLTAVISSFELITNSPSSGSEHDLAGWLVTLFMIGFTIIFGVRKLDPTERHQGMIAALVAECIVKLIAFIAVGVFATYILFDGFGDIFNRLQQADLGHVASFSATKDSGIMWLTLCILSFSAVYNLPRQFHVSVVENSNKQHIKTAMWVFPLYMVLINLFVVPIAAAGLLQGMPKESADFFVLLLPQQAGFSSLTLLAFIGGFSAATGMTIITAMTLSTMASNHLILPALERIPSLQFLRSYLLQLRWIVVSVIMVGSLWFSKQFADSYILVAIGLLSFVAVLQFSPALFGGLFWKKGNSLGAFLGLLSGFTVWCYSLLIPTFIKHGWFSESLLIEGPWQIALLRPEALFGLEGLSPVPHAVFWSLLINIGCYIFGSLIFSPNKSERNLTSEFISSMNSAQSRRARPTGLDAYILLEPKLEEAKSLLSNYLPADKAEQEVLTIAEDLQVRNKPHITIIELVEFHRMVEHVLAGSIGAASAHQAIENTIRYNNREEADLKALYSHIVTELQTTEKESPGQSSSGATGYGIIEELQSQIDDLEDTVASQQKQIAHMEKRIEIHHAQAFKYRLETQKTKQDNSKLRKELKLKLGDEESESE